MLFSCPFHPQVHPTVKINVGTSKSINSFDLSLSYKGNTEVDLPVGDLSSYHIYVCMCVFVYGEPYA